MTAPIVASSKQVSYYYVPEITEGETPVTPAFIRIPKKPGELKEPANNDPFDSTGENVALKAQLKINGKPSNVVTSISLKLDNGVAQAHVVGQRAVATTGLGNSSVTGSLAFLYIGNDISDLFINREDVSLEFTLSGKGGAYTFLLPRIKLTSESPGEQDVFTIINSDFQALLDPATGTNLQITRKAEPAVSQPTGNVSPSA